MNKNNKKVLGYIAKEWDEHYQESKILEYGRLDFENILNELPVIGEDIRRNDILVITNLKVLRKTIKQLIEYILLLDSEGIHLVILEQPYLTSNGTIDPSLIRCLKAIDKASKTTLSVLSKNIEGSGAKLGSYNKEVDASIVGMYSIIKNVSAISTALNVSRNTVYKSIKRHNLK